MLILGIESSCDETAAAVLANGDTLLSNVINSQISIHEKYGGVVPEIASRQHVKNIFPVVAEAIKQAGVSLDQIDGIAVTQGPGLIGSLLIGHCFAKALSLVKKIPYAGIDHLTGHLLSVFLSDDHPEFPYIAMIASGGHSSIFHVTSHSDFRLMGRTRDDAAGEAFDKVAKLLGLGYPGGPVISKLAQDGNPSAINFPRAWLDKESLDFSFSGLKTAVASYVYQQNKNNLPLEIPDICASFQEAVVEVMVKKTMMAAQNTDSESVVIAGGVAANPRLRQAISEEGKNKGVKIFMPPTEFCTDNAAMIALAGYYQFKEKASLRYDSDVYSRSQF
ncbi:MAG: tRNA (adenosine(37)-N6)-threonylcarbamoyltransferase complex transferase subunit TsaD [Proteobacteria bacterium]|nr:tRNA (adenosine(37)-N6)-threonylcarbamoyltransferase complex transferase subunit TsaD [Pseudomonadota bacterium]MBU1714564.1 tRNA (adenosine(37)-N6)-threonylcarbamoyltransferase complex transferase subunit TsaD [Pseudomonadota bacterium]